MIWTRFRRRFGEVEALPGRARAVRSLVVKDWDAHARVAPPLAGARVLRGLKAGRPVSAGELLARHPDPRRGDVHASINGFIEEINEFEIVIRRDDQAVGEPPSPAELSDCSAGELAVRLKELGLDPPLPEVDGPLIVSALAAEPGLDLAPALFAERRETILAGVEALARLQPGREIVWAARRAEEAPAGVRTVAVKGDYPYTLPALIKKKITGGRDPLGRGVFGGRELHRLGRVWRTGLPAAKMPLTLGGANYFVPVGARIIDLLTFANLAPDRGDVVVLGGLIRGFSLARLERGLDRSAEALHLVRRAELSGPAQPCRSCGRCARACPAGLPVDLPAARPLEEWLDAPPEAGWDGCFRCGACALACPARRPLMSLARLLSGASSDFK